MRRQIREDRYYAVHMLGELRDRRSVDVLVPLLGDPDVNYKVAWALGQIGDARAIAPFIAALDDPDALSVCRLFRPSRPWMPRKPSQAAGAAARSGTAKGRCASSGRRHGSGGDPHPHPPALMAARRRVHQVAGFGPGSGTLTG